jgi:RNA polymerase sigma-70 factor, ECF subfamily
MMAASRMPAPQDPSNTTQLDHGPDASQISEWIESQQLWLWRYLRFLGAPAESAEDICQETLLAALHHQVPDRSPAVAIAWLRTTACNFYRKQLRRSRQRDAMQRLLAREQLATTADLIHTAADNSYRDALRACMQQLTGDARQLLDMRYRDNASRSAMAAATGRSEESVKTILRRTKERLRNCIERRRTP